MRDDDGVGRRDRSCRSRCQMRPQNGPSCGQRHKIIPLNGHTKHRFGHTPGERGELKNDKARVRPGLLLLLTRRSNLPDPHPLIGSEIEFFAGLDVEGRVPSVDVADGVGTVFVGRMAVRHHDHPQRLGPHLATPALPECDEEPLIAGQAFGGGSFLAAVCSTVCVVGGRKPGDIGDILAERLFAVEVQAGQRLICVVLGRELVRRRLKMLEVLRRPPVEQSSRRRRTGCPCRRSCG